MTWEEGEEEGGERDLRFTNLPYLQLGDGRIQLCPVEVQRWSRQVVHRRGESTQVEMRMTRKVS